MGFDLTNQNITDTFQNQLQNLLTHHHKTMDHHIDHILREKWVK